MLVRMSFVPSNLADDLLQLSLYDPSGAVE